jgi:hypothetical protein
VILAGLIMFNIFSRIGPPKRHQLSPWEGPPGH